MSVTIYWLDATFYVLATATPIPNGVMDFKGYMRLIEMPEAEEWWSPESLFAMGLEEDVDPYLSIPDDHPGVKLRLTEIAAKNFIFRPSVPAVE